MSIAIAAIVEALEFTKTPRAAMQIINKIWLRIIQDFRLPKDFVRIGKPIESTIGAHKNFKPYGKEIRENKPMVLISTLASTKKTLRVERMRASGKPLEKPKKKMIRISNCGRFLVENRIKKIEFMKRVDKFMRLQSYSLIF